MWHPVLLHLAAGMIPWTSPGVLLTWDFLALGSRYSITTVSFTAHLFWQDLRLELSFLPYHAEPG